MAVGRGPEVARALTARGAGGWMLPWALPVQVRRVEQSRSTRAFFFFFQHFFPRVPRGTDFVAASFLDANVLLLLIMS